MTTTAGPAAGRTQGTAQGPTPTGPAVVPPAPGRRLTPTELVLLGTVTALGALSIDLYLPGFPELARDLGTTEAAVELTLTACVVGLALGQLVAGPVSDALGRKRPVVAGMAAWSLAALACALAPSVATLTALRFAQGLAAGVGVVVARAVVRDLASGEALARAFARLMLVVGVVPIAAPSVGGLILQATTWRGMFVALAVLGALITGVVLWLLPESLPAERRRRGGAGTYLRSYASLLRDPAFLAPAAVVGLTFGAMFAYISNSSFVLRAVFDLTASQFGLVFGLCAVGLVAGTQSAPALAHRAGGRAVLLGGLALGSTAALVLLGLAVADVRSLAGTVAGLTVLVVAVGLVMPMASSRAMSGHPERAGAASGLMGLFQFAVGGAIGPVVGHFGTTSLLPLAVAMAVCLSGALAVAATGSRRG